MALQARAEVVEELRPLADRVIELAGARRALRARIPRGPAPPRARTVRARARADRSRPARSGCSRPEASSPKPSWRRRRCSSCCDQACRGEEIAVVYRSPARAAPLVEHVFGRYGIAVATEETTGFRRTALGRSLLALARCALLAAAEARAEDLLEYLRAPGLLERPDVADRLEAEVRREGVRTAAEARARLRFGLPEIDALRAARGSGGRAMRGRPEAARRPVPQPRAGARPRRAARRPRRRGAGARAGRARGARREAVGRRADRAARDARSARRRLGPRRGRRYRCGPPHRSACDPRQAVSRRARVRPAGERVSVGAGARAVPLGRAPARARDLQRPAAPPARGRARARALPVLHERVAGDRAGGPELSQLGRGGQPGAALAVRGRCGRAARRGVARAAPAADARRCRVAGRRCADRARARAQPRGRGGAARGRGALPDRVAVGGGAPPRPPPPDPVGGRARVLRQLSGAVADRARAPAAGARARPRSARPRGLHAHRDRAGAAAARRPGDAASRCRTRSRSSTRSSNEQPHGIAPGAGAAVRAAAARGVVRGPAPLPRPRGP